MDIPKCPRKMVDIIKQVEAHPNFQKLEPDTLFTWRAMRCGFTKQGSCNNGFIKEVWRTLFLDFVAPLPMEQEK